MSRFAQTANDTKVLSTGHPKRYLVKAPNEEEFTDILDALQTLVKKHQARLLDYDGKHLVLLFDVAEDQAKALLKDFSDKVIVRAGS